MPVVGLSMDMIPKDDSDGFREWLQGVVLGGTELASGAAGWIPSKIMGATMLAAGSLQPEEELTAERLKSRPDLKTNKEFIKAKAKDIEEKMGKAFQKPVETLAHGLPENKTQGKIMSLAEKALTPFTWV